MDRVRRVHACCKKWQERQITFGQPIPLATVANQTSTQGWWVVEQGSARRQRTKPNRLANSSVRNLRWWQKKIRRLESKSLSKRAKVEDVESKLSDTSDSAWDAASDDQGNTDVMPPNEAYVHLKIIFYPVWQRVIPPIPSVSEIDYFHKLRSLSIYCEHREFIQNSQPSVTSLAISTFLKHRWPQLDLKF